MAYRGGHMSVMGPPSGLQAHHDVDSISSKAQGARTWDALPAAGMACTAFSWVSATPLEVKILTQAMLNSST